MRKQWSCQHGIGCRGSGFPARESDGRRNDFVLGCQPALSTDGDHRLLIRLDGSAFSQLMSAQTAGAFSETWPLIAGARATL
jgi:hypothetical protein